MKKKPSSPPMSEDFSEQGMLLKDLSALLNSCISHLSRKEGLVESVLKKEALYQKFMARDLSGVQEDTLLHDLITHFLRLDTLLKKCSLDNLLLGLSQPSVRLTIDHSKDLLEIEARILHFLKNPYAGLTNLRHQGLLDIVTKSQQALKSCLTLLRCDTFFPDKICAPLLAFFGKKEPTVKILHTMCLNFTKNEKTWNVKEMEDYEKQFLKICSAFLYNHQNIEQFYCELCLYHQEHKPAEQLSSFSLRNKTPKISQFRLLSEFVQHIKQCYCLHLSRLHAFDESNFSFFAFKCSLASDLDDTSAEAVEIEKLYETVKRERLLVSPTELITPSDIALLEKFYRLQLKLFQAKHNATLMQLKTDTSSEADPAFL